MNEARLEDLRLVRAARDDPRAADRVVERLYSRVYQAVYLMVGRDQEADDLAQACLVEIVEHLQEYRGTGPLEAWAGRVSHRVLVNHMRKRRRTNRVLSLVDQEVGVSSESTERAAERARARERLASFMGKLPPERRISLVLRLVYEHSVAEVAELTGVSVNTTKDRLRTGLRELRGLFDRDPEARELMAGVVHAR